MTRRLVAVCLGLAWLLTGSAAQAAQGAGVKQPADFTVWRSQTGYFYSRSLAGASTAQQWGASTDMPVVGDFDGDGKPDVAVWRPSTGYWYIIQSSNGQVVTHQWGAATDVPVVGDFDGDGKADIAVWRPSTGYWYILQSSNGQVVTHQWGAATDLPVIGDFDGDGKTDIAVWRPSTGYWYIMESSSKATVAKQFGATTDVPVAGDFDGDGKTDIAVWRESTGYWYIVQSSNGAVIAKQWGQSGDIPVPKDYDGDGKTDLAVWRPATGYWYVVESGNGATAAVQWGASTDEPANGSLEPLALTTSSSSPTYTIGGRVIGLKAGATVHVLNGSDDYTVSANGSFTLPTALSKGAAFNVSVGTMPAGQVCALQNGSGTVASANVTSVLVYCTYVQSTATLNGSYVGAGYNINNNWVALSNGTPFNGGSEGNTTTGITNSAGTITTSSNSSGSAGPYTVATTNAIPVLTDNGNNIGAIAGADADEFFWIADASTADGGGLPALAVWLRPLQNATIAGLAGTWFTVGIDQGSDPDGYGGVLTIGTDGSVTGTLTSLDVNGVVSTHPQSAPAGTFTVTSGGQFSNGSNALGYFSANGEMLLAANVVKTSGANPTGMSVSVKLGANVTQATLNGVYTVGGMGFNSTAGTTGDGRVYTLFFDGAGNYSGTYIDNANGAISTGNTTSGTYSLASTGALTITQADGGVRTGAISADGNIIVAANLTAGGTPKIFVGFRQ